MAIRAPKVRKHLSADALLGLLQSGIADIGDPRPGDPDISLSDALMSAFALFSRKRSQGVSWRGLASSLL